MAIQRTVYTAWALTLCMCTVVYTDGTAAEGPTHGAAIDIATLFNIPLVTGTCQQLHEAIKARGGKLLKEPGFNDMSIFSNLKMLIYGTGWYDWERPVYHGRIYDSSTLLKDSDELDVGWVRRFLP